MTDDSRRILARFTTYGGLLDALRNRLDEKQITHRVFDDIAGIADGLTNKMLQPNPVKFLIPNMLGDFVEAAGCQLWLVEDPEFNASLERRLAHQGRDAWPKLRRELHRDGYLTPKQLSKAAAQIAPEVRRENARKANAVRNAVLSSEQRSQIARYAAYVRWNIKMRHHLRKARRKAATGP